MLKTGFLIVRNIGSYFHLRSFYHHFNLYVNSDTGEVIAAISMALHDHLDAHDRESTILTINKVRRAYSPWSSKIYSLRELPRR